MRIAVLGTGGVGGYFGCPNTVRQRMWATVPEEQVCEAVRMYLPMAARDCASLQIPGESAVD